METKKAERVTSQQNQGYIDVAKYTFNTDDNKIRKQDSSFPKNETIEQSNSEILLTKQPDASPSQDLQPQVPACQLTE